MNKIKMKQPSNKSIYFTILLFLLQFPAYTQGWEKTFGGTGNDEFRNISSTQDGGYIICGQSNSFTSEGAAYVIKIDADGNEQWSNLYGGIDAFQSATDIQNYYDGGYILGGIGLGPNGSIDVFLTRLTVTGDTIWTRYFGGLDAQYDGNFTQLPDHSLVYTARNEGDNGIDIYAVRVDENGDMIWEKTFDQTEDASPRDIITTTDNTLLISGGIFIDEGNNDVYLLELDIDGNEINSATYGGPNGEGAFGVIQTSDGGFLTCGLTSSFLEATDTTANVYLVRTDANFDTIWTNSVGGLLYDNAHHIIENADGSFTFSGLTDPSVSGSSDVMLGKVDANGQLIWYRNFGGIAPDWAGEMVAAADGGYVIVGRTQSFGFVNGANDGYLIKTNDLGFSYSNTINGKVFFDENENCNQEVDESDLEGWLIRAASDTEVYYGLSYEGGAYSITVDTGEYVVEVIPPNNYWNWQSCTTNDLSLLSYYDTTTIDMSAWSAFECPLLSVDLGAPFLRRCFENNYTIRYCNEGTLPAEDAYIEVTFDDYLNVVSSTLPSSAQNGNTYTFEVGDVAIGDCNDFQVTVEVDCDNTVLGQTHCSTAHIYPDSICGSTSPDWDGSSIIVDAECEGDSVLFRIINIGEPMTQNLEYIVIEDHIIFREGNFQLDNSTNNILEFKEAAFGKTLRLEAQQAIGHPGEDYPAISIEGCSEDGEIYTGYVLDFYENDANPFLSIDCQENIASYDPNDKQAFPNGIGEDHCINPNVDIEYKIRFQNTGTDTAFTVVITDTLSQFLDITTVRAGASSHPYKFDIYGDGILKFTFNNIMLPDSNVNEVASHGFIKFRVDQISDNPEGSQIFNKAAIYFDFNEPIITNETYHTVADECITVSIIEIEPTSVSTIRVYPNPFEEMTTFELLNKVEGDYAFELYNISGQLIYKEKFDEAQYNFYRKNIASGMYLYKITTKGISLDQGKITMF